MEDGENSISRIKRRLMSFYMILLTVEIFLYAAMYYFVTGNTIFAFCLLAFFFVIFYTYLLIHKVKIELVCHLFFFYSLLLIIFASLNLQRDSIVVLFWLIPVPLGSYVLLGKKAFIFYSAVVVAVMLAVTVVSEFFNIAVFDIYFPKHILWITDRFAWLCNLVTFVLLIHFNHEIQEVSKKASFKEKTKASPEDTLFKNPSKDENSYQDLFEKIQRIVKTNFKDPDLSVGKIVNKLNSNHLYISYAIKNGGFDNFNNFVNSVRISYVKKQIEEGALETTTLLYICRDAGFSNYSTFIRAFKKNAGIAPAEYLRQLNLTDRV
jgi:AraC-like DNA-binding protein